MNGLCSRCGLPIFVQSLHGSGICTLRTGDAVTEDDWYVISGDRDSDMDETKYVEGT
jgi:hypothetical protein